MPCQPVPDGPCGVTPRTGPTNKSPRVRARIGRSVYTSVVRHPTGAQDQYLCANDLVSLAWLIRHVTFDSIAELETNVVLLVNVADRRSPCPAVSTATIVSACCHFANASRSTPLLTMIGTGCAANVVPEVPEKSRVYPCDGFFVTGASTVLTCLPFQ